MAATRWVCILALNITCHAPSCRRIELAAAPELLLQKLSGATAGLPLRREQHVQQPGIAGYKKQAAQHQEAHDNHHLGDDRPGLHPAQQNCGPAKRIKGDAESSKISWENPHDLSTRNFGMLPSLVALSGAPAGMAASGVTEGPAGTQPASIGMQGLHSGATFAGFGMGLSSPVSQLDGEHSNDIKSQPDAGLHGTRGMPAVQCPPWMQHSGSDEQLELLFCGRQRAQEQQRQQSVAACASLFALQGVASLAAASDPLDELFEAAKQRRPLHTARDAGGSAACLWSQQAQQHGALAHQQDQEPQLGCGQQDEGTELQGWRSSAEQCLNAGAQSDGCPLMGMQIVDVADDSASDLRISCHPSHSRCTPPACKLAWVEQPWVQAQAHPDSSDGEPPPFLSS
jgi:hypothetical protein